VVNEVREHHGSEKMYKFTTRELKNLRRRLNDGRRGRVIRNRIDANAAQLSKAHSRVKCRTAIYKRTAVLGARRQQATNGVERRNL
jgi:hypothetical protein